MTNIFFTSDLHFSHQNILKYCSIELEVWKEQEYTFEMSEKYDGSSMTAYIYNGEFGVCSRNLDLKFDENNTFWKVAIKNKFEEKLRKLNRNIAIQGELIGTGVNGNIYKLNTHEFHLFDVYDIDKGEYLRSEDRLVFAEENDINHVNILGNTKILNNYNIDMLLDLAEGYSHINLAAQREGLVFKCLENPSISFKAISNKFLLKNGG